MKSTTITRSRIGIVLFAGVVAFLAPGAAGAETEGFTLGLDLHYSRIGAEEESESSPENSVFVDQDGGGFTLLIGYGFTPSFALRLSASGSNHKTTDSDVDVLYSNGLIEALYIFAPGEPVRPYLLGGLGGCNLQSRMDPFRYETTGSCASLGFGVLFFVSEHFAFDSAARIEFVNWKTATATLETDLGDVTVETPVEDQGSAGKILLGATYWF
jgi:hypothetical protein